MRSLKSYNPTDNPRYQTHQDFNDNYSKLYESEKEFMKNTAHMVNNNRYHTEQDNCQNTKLWRDWKSHSVEYLEEVEDPMIDLHSLVNDSHEWVNIQEVVRVGFQYVSNKLYEQDSQIRMLYQQIEQKTDRQLFEQQIAKKSNAEEINTILGKLSLKLDSKVSSDELDRALSHSASKEKLDEISSTVEKLAPWIGLQQKEQEIRTQIESINGLLHQFRTDSIQQFKLIIDKIPQIDHLK